MQNKLKNTIRSQLAAVTAAEKQQPFLKLLPAGIIQPVNCNFRNPPAGQGKRLQALYIIQQPFPDYGPGEVAVVRDLSQRQDIGTDSVDRFCYADTAKQGKRTADGDDGNLFFLSHFIH